MKWFNDKRKEIMLRLDKTVQSIRSQQVMQWLELISTSIEGLREIGEPLTEADKINHATFMRIFKESICELEKYVSRFEISSESSEYTICLSDEDANKNDIMILEHDEN